MARAPDNQYSRSGRHIVHHDYSKLDSLGFDGLKLGDESVDRSDAESDGQISEVGEVSDEMDNMLSQINELGLLGSRTDLREVKRESQLPKEEFQHVHPTASVDSELEFLRLKKQRCLTELARREKQSEIISLRAEIAELEAKCPPAPPLSHPPRKQRSHGSVRFSSKHHSDVKAASKPAVSSSKFGDKDKITLDNLRRNKDLSDQVANLLADDDIFSTHHVTSRLREGKRLESPQVPASRSRRDISSDSCSSDSDHQHRGKDRKYRRKIRSGRRKTCDDSVLFPQRWPQSALSLQYVSQKVSYDDLTTPLFVAGYVQEILDDEPISDIAAAKLDHLVNLMYTAANHPWELILDINAAVFNCIEMGKKDWGDNFFDIESRIVQNFKPKQKGSNTRQSFQSRNSNRPRNSPVPMFCRQYQTGKCTFSSSSHHAILRGNSVTVNHICASCALLEGVRREHPESSRDCPHFSSNQEVNKSANKSRNVDREDNRQNKFSA